MKKFKRIGEPVDVPSLGLVDVAAGTEVEVRADLTEGFEGREDWEHVPDPERSRAAKKAAETRAQNDDEKGDA